MDNRIVGYRFKPTDEQLISYFLKHKMDGNDFYVDHDIAEIDLCKHEPWELPAMEKSNKDQVWYFFCRRDLKYPKSQRANRTTKAGYWKSTGKDRQIKARRTKEEIGTKKTLVFHEGRLPGGVKTNWIIHEYKAKTILPHQRPFVLCKLKKKGDEKTNSASCNEGEPSHHLPSEFENAVEVPIPQVDPELLPESIIIKKGSDFSHPSMMQQHNYIEQSSSSENILLINDLSNGFNALRPQFDTVEEEEDAMKLADSFLVDPADSDCGNVTDISAHEYNYDESVDTHINNSRTLKSSSGEYLEDISDADTEVTHEEARKATVPGAAIDLTQTESSVNLSWKETFIMVSDHHEILVMEGSSAGSETEKYIYSLELVFDDVFDYITAHNPGLVAQKATMDGPAIVLPQEEISVNMPQTETYEKVLKAHASLKLRTIGLAENSGMCSFIYLETPPSIKPYTESTISLRC